MRLKKFQVMNYRSISDSGPIRVDHLTALVGRNESGKSNLLRALLSLKPAEGLEELPHENFPRHRHIGECTDETKIVTSTWELDEEEKAELAGIWPRAEGASKVVISRCYGPVRQVGFQPIPAHKFDRKSVRSKIREVVDAVKSSADSLDESVRSALDSAVDTFKQSVKPSGDYAAWASAAKPALAALRDALDSAGNPLDEAQVAPIECLEELVDDIAEDEEKHQAARSWAVKKMPIFIFLDQYPALSGDQDISEYLQRQEQGQATEADENFKKMCKVAGLDPEEVQSCLASGDSRMRNILQSEADRTITEKIQSLWTDRDVRVQFRIDANQISTSVLDPKRDSVPINLSERSRGFQWFFSFYVTFAADTDGGEASNAILLLDEPGLYLHAKSQGDLLNHLDGGFRNQVIYTTHSPFMVPTHKLDSVRTVNISDEFETTVSNNPSTGDSKTLFPLQSALGYDLAQSLFIGPKNLVVEGVTDFWILSSISGYLHDTRRSGLARDVTITPVGGAQKIHYMVALLSAENLDVLVLLDHEKDTEETKNRLISSTNMRDKNILFVSEAFKPAPPKSVAIEDLLDPEVYESLVKEAYASDLEKVARSINKEIPQIAKRFDVAFKKAGLEFRKTRPARLLLEKMSSEPGTIVTEEVADRFSRLYARINDRFRKIGGSAKTR